MKQKKLALLTKTNIIANIFTLVSQKLNIELSFINDDRVDEQYDIIIIDDEFINEHFNINKPFCQSLGAITSNKLSFEKSTDFIIPRPFLPMQLQNILIKEFENIRQKLIKGSKEEIVTKTSDHLTPAIDYLESLAEDIAQDIEYESDESIINPSNINLEDTEGGVLDANELSKIQSILKNGYDTPNDSKEYFEEADEMSERDWHNLSDIIDKAIDDIKGYDIEQDYNEPIELILNRYSIEQLKPLFEKLDQNIIDTLTSGNRVMLELILNNDEKRTNE